MNLRSVVSIVGFGGAMVCFAIGIVEAISASHGPLTPAFAQGLVIPFNNHGTIHYISHTHQVWLVRAFWGGVSLFLLSFGCAVLPSARNGRA